MKRLLLIVAALPLTLLGLAGAARLSAGGKDCCGQNRPCCQDEKACCATAEKTGCCQEGQECCGQ